MKLSWILALHLTQIGWASFVASAIASGHAVWWESAIAATLAAVDGAVTIAQTHTVQVSLLPLKLSIKKKS